MTGLGAAAFALLAAILCAAPVRAEPPPVVALPTGDAFVQPFASMRHLVDEAGTLTVEDVRARAQDFRPVPTDWIDFGRRDERIWLWARVRNAAPRPERWILDLQRQRVDEVAVYRAVPGGPAERLLALTARSPLADRPVRSRYIALPLELSAGETADILIAFRSRTGTWMPVTFATPERFRTAHAREERINWTLTGGLAALVAVALALGPVAGWPLALGYAAYAAAGGLFVAHNEGYLFRYVWPDHPWLFERANLFLLFLFLAAGLHFCRRFVAAGAAYPRLGRALSWSVPPLLAAAALGGTGLATGSLTVAAMVAVPAGAALYLASAVAAVRLGRMGGFAFAAGAVALALTIGFAGLVLAFPGRFANTVALDILHLAIVFESVAFLAAIVVRVLRLKDDLARSLASELDGARERLRLAAELEENRRRYDETRRLAEAHRARLAATAHDLQQPLMALRGGLGAAAPQDENVRAALSYLEALATRGLEESRPGEMAAEAPDEGRERFPLAIIARNCEAMFRREAEAAGARLSARAGDVEVVADPVVLMRIAGNLVANAVRHAGASRILIAARGAGDRTLLHVVDDGRGMSEEELERVLRPYAKGEESDGTGLGLHLVNELCAAEGIGLSLRSRPGRGLCVTLSIPRG